jgi:hypothetical protein
MVVIRFNLLNIDINNKLLIMNIINKIQKSLPVFPDQPQSHLTLHFGAKTNMP